MLCLQTCISYVHTQICYINKNKYEFNQIGINMIPPFDSNAYICSSFYVLNATQMKPTNRSCYCWNSLKIVYIAGLIIPLLMSSCVVQRRSEIYAGCKQTQDTYNEADFKEIISCDRMMHYIYKSTVLMMLPQMFLLNLQAIYTLDPYSAYMTAYTVDKEGFIELPVIGRIHVSGKTTIQVSEMIKDSMVNILSHPMVTVKLVNQYVSVLGEVNRPGHFVYSQDKLTIYDALGLAGDISVYGNRRDVILCQERKWKEYKDEYRSYPGRHSILSLLLHSAQ